MTTDSTLLFNVLAQLPVVAAFVWFVIYLLKYIAEQQKQRDETWLKQLGSFSSTCDSVNERLIKTIESQDTRWQQFVQQRDEQYREVLKELQTDMRTHAIDNRVDIRELREVIQELIARMNDLLAKVEGAG